MHFPIRAGIFHRSHGAVRAIDGVTLAVKEGETLGVVGESGCGKTTLGRIMARLYKPTAGMVTYRGRDLNKMSRADVQTFRREVQVIFQDPYESLNSRQTVGSILSEPFVINRIGDRKFREAEVTRLLERVGLPARAITKYPHEFSGGQRQRIGIARALALNPKVVVCDEPVSALDVSIQSQILNLLLDLQNELGLTLVFIAHDLAVVRHISDRIAVMYLGKVVELGNAEALCARPEHPYTRALISAVASPDPGDREARIILQGEVPSPAAPPPGCVFQTRCPRAEAHCRVDAPELKQKTDPTNPGLVACHFVE
jgi:oligopeptide/dipeptide ABC transporter ATP-binding protein